MPGGGGSQTVTQEFKPPEWTQQGWKDYLSSAQNLASQGLPQYGGQMVADISPMQAAGLQMLGGYAMQGTPERVAGGQAIVNAAQGQLNPYSITANPYMGQNPYLSQMIDTSNAKIMDQFRRGTADQTDAMYARSGAFGGSAWEQAQKRNAETLAGALAANTNNLLGQNYQQSAQLAESGLGRASQGWQSGIQNALQAAQVGQGQQQLDAAAIQQMIAGGQIPRDYQQQLLTAAQQYFQQGQQIPFFLSDYLGNALSRASGSYGGETTQQPGQSPITGLLGAGSILAGLL